MYIKIQFTKQLSAGKLFATWAIKKDQKKLYKIKFKLVQNSKNGNKRISLFYKNRLTNELGRIKLRINFKKF